MPRIPASIPGQARQPGWTLESAGGHEPGSSTTNQTSAVRFQGNPRVHIALKVGDLERSIGFYRVLQLGGLQLLIRGQDSASFVVEQGATTREGGACSRISRYGPLLRETVERFLGRVAHRFVGRLERFLQGRLAVL